MNSLLNYIKGKETFTPIGLQAALMDPLTGRASWALTGENKCSILSAKGGRQDGQARDRSYRVLGERPGGSRQVLRRHLWLEDPADAGNELRHVRGGGRSGGRVQPAER